MNKYIVDTVEQHVALRKNFIPWSKELREKAKLTNFRDVFKCFDCRVNTAKIGETYYVHDHLWPLKTRGKLCLSCLEKRLGQKLTHEDFTNSKCNAEDPEYENKFWPKSHQFQRRLMLKIDKVSK